ncbi:conserved hypothetical protein [Histoplasma capsulatum G186AR]|uniref:AB hydrolase-1 domain-containing protein n=2 Tax=Ajellomyces capsulatus TaxID=5037 RepID=C0NCP8_AJECG|nr:uncharacterized protein HCBG_00894 [Histoplasma capsulatum G186AR]EEH11439.1 conserved hypothetical protein [Histoplasma capsulatum G186AR]
MEPTNTNWQYGEHEGLVSIANHCLFLGIYGPNRSAGDPIVIIIPDVASSSRQWTPVRRLLQRKVRTMLYDRSGLGDSEEMPNPTAPTAENISLELDVLLGAADIKPPYIIVCHAYGGIIAREFLHLKQFKGELHDMVGLVFVEGDQENTTALRPDENVKRMSEGQDWLRLTGLYQDMVLDPEDRESLYLEAETAKFKETAEAECGEVANSCRELGQKKQLEADPPLLGSVPVSVVMGDTTRDHERIYEAAVRSGKEGIPSPAAWQRKIAEFKELDETLQLANLNLSTKGSIAIAGNSGHNVHLTEPDTIVGEVQWILDTINNQQ